MTLGVELINDRDIVVSHPETGFSVTYRKDGDAPMLVAIDSIDERDIDLEKLNFLARAWKAAHQKARAIVGCVLDRHDNREMHLSRRRRLRPGASFLVAARDKLSERLQTVVAVCSKFFPVNFGIAMEDHVQ